MDEQVRKYVEQYPSAIVNMYHALRTLILDSAPAAPQEKLWAKRLGGYLRKHCTKGEKENGSQVV